MVFASIVVEIRHDASSQNKASYMATNVVCGKVGAIFEVIWAVAVWSKKIKS